MRTGRWAFVIVPVAVQVAEAQTSAAIRADSVACEGLRVTAITVTSRERIAVDDVRPGFVRPILRAVLRATPNKPSALRPHMLLSPGSVCTEARRRESEHLLRDLRYVADASVRAEPDGDGVRLVVEATDDLRPVVGMGLDGARPESFEYGTVSLAGNGIFVAGDWVDGGAFRDGFGLRVTDWTALGRRAIASLSLARRPLGQLTLVGLGEPYLTRFQALAWDLSLRDETQYVPLERNADEPAAWRTEWRTFNAAAVRRIQLGPLQLLAGGLFTHERATPSDSGVVIGEQGLEPPPAELPGNLYGAQSGGRAGVIVGVRALSFQRVEGLEALEGAHDVARGVQFATAFGAGVSGGDDHPFTAAEAFAGAGGRTSFASVRATFEQRDTDVGGQARLASGRFAWYWLASRRQTQELSVEFTGLWREDLPIALFLDDRRTGPRGFVGARASGTRLLVGRLERRVRAGGFSRAVGLGVAGFLDAAKLWAGDAPLGVTTDPLVGAGVGFLVAVPRDSRKTIRLDAAYPLTKTDGTERLNVRLTITTAGRAYWREPAAFGRSRVVPVLRSLVGWF
jgi:hypothetical protein